MKRTIIAMIMLTVAAGVATAQNLNNREEVVKCAQEGNSVCQNLLGKWIFEGSQGYKQDYEKAVAWWLQAAKQNNDEATANLGFCYQYGLGVKADSTTASRLFVKAFKQGNARLVQMHDSLARSGSVFSAMLLGKCYKMAYGLPRDQGKSVKYYKMAAEQGQVEAMRETAILMRNAKDDANALAWFNKAQQKGDVASTYYYGKMLCEGRGTARDAATGLTYLQKAADQGYGAAQYDVAEAYAKGSGVERDDAKALRWYARAATSGNRAAWWQMAECYREGRGTKVDFEEALYCYAKASDLGYHNKLKGLLEEGTSQWKGTPFGHYLKGMHLLKYYGKPNEAIKEFAKLPKQLPVRHTMEAVCMMHPAYEKINMKKVVKQLRKIEQADPRAAYELALLQMKGQGMEKNVAAAEKKLKELSDAGYVPATSLLAGCYYNGGALPVDKQKAILLYLQEEKQGRLSAEGAYRLAKAYRNGEGGVKVNVERAEELEKYKAPNPVEMLEKIGF